MTMPADERATLTHRDYAVQAYLKTGGWNDVAEGRDCDSGFDEAVDIFEQALKEADRRAREDAARIIDARFAEVMNKQDGRDPDIDLQVRMMAVLLPELSTAIRASITTAEGE